MQDLAAMIKLSMDHFASAKARFSALATQLSAQPKKGDEKSEKTESKTASATATTLVCPLIASAELASARTLTKLCVVNSLAMMSAKKFADAHVTPLPVANTPVAVPPSAGSETPISAPNGAVVVPIAVSVPSAAAAAQRSLASLDFGQHDFMPTIVLTKPKS